MRLCEERPGRENLSRRERQVAEPYAQGLSYKQIADGFCIALATVRTHLGTIYRKLGVSTKIELLRTLQRIQGICLRAFATFDVRARLGEIDMPTLVIGGDRDRSIALAQLIQLRGGIRGAQLCVAPNCAHNVHLEKPGLFNRVGDFLLAGGNSPQASARP